MSLQKFKTYQLSIELYRLCRTLSVPEHLRDQLLRAAASVTLNLAEGSAKPTAKDQRKYYAISFGSLRECQAVFALLEIRHERIAHLVDILGASLFKLSRP